MSEILAVVINIIIGLAGGLAVGGGFVAFLVVLDIIPRLAQISKSYQHICWLEGAVVSGAMFWTAAEFFNWRFSFFSLSASFVGVFAGLFVGMLAGALTEVLNVFPILAKRLNMGNFIILLLMSMVIGKVVGSLFDWIVFRAM